MAITNSDGSIILSTKVDTSGVKDGFKEANKFAEMSANKQRSLAQSLSGVYRKQGMAQSEAQKKAWRELKNGTVAAKDYEEALKDVENRAKKFGTQAQKSGKQAKVAFDGLNSTLRSVAGYLAMAFSVTKLVQFSSESSKLATQTEASVQRLIDIYGQASDAVGDFIDANARALGMSKAAAASYASVYGNLFSVWADQKTNAELTNNYLNMTAVVASKTGRTVADVQERIRSGLLGNTEAIEDLGIFVNVKTIEITDAFQRIADGRSWEQLTAYEQSQVRTLAILEQSTKKYGTQVADTTQAVRLRFQAAYEDFKNTWGQLVNVVLIPVLTTLTKIFSVATAIINTLTGNTGSVMGESSQQNITGQIKDNIAESTENQKEFTGAVEETNKELKKTLAGFDDLQILTSPDAKKDQNGTIVGGTDSGAGGALGIPSLPQAGNQGGFDPMAIVTKLAAALNFILPLIELSLVVIGLILLSAGQIGWGLGFIFAGAYLYTVSERSVGTPFDFSIVKRDIDTILPYIDEALVAIGILLMFLGQIPIGIGFIIAGAMYYGAHEVMSSDQYDGTDATTKLAIIAEAVSVSLVAIGMILLFLGNIPLALGFVVAGAAMLDVTEEHLQEKNVETELYSFFERIMEFIGKAGLAMAALGLILVIFGAHGLGFSLIIKGLGLAGFTEIVANWDFIVEKIKNVWEKIKAFWNGEIAPIFSEQWWNILGVTCINGLIAGFEGGINLIIVMFENMVNLIISGINRIRFQIPEWAGGGYFAPNIPPVNLGRVSFGRIPLPSAATGSLVPNSSVTQRPFINSVTDAATATTMDGSIGGYGGVRNAITEVVLEVDGREFGRAVVEQGGIENRRIGTRMVVI